MSQENGRTTAVMSFELSLIPLRSTSTFTSSAILWFTHWFLFIILVLAAVKCSWLLKKWPLYRRNCILLSFFFFFFVKIRTCCFHTFMMAQYPVAKYLFSFITDCFTFPPLILLHISISLRVSNRLPLCVDINSGKTAKSIAANLIRGGVVGTHTLGRLTLCWALLAGALSWWKIASSAERCGRFFMKASTKISFSFLVSAIGMHLENGYLVLWVMIKN